MREDVKREISQQERKKEEEEGSESTMAWIIRAATFGICQVTEHVLLMLLGLGVAGICERPREKEDPT